MLATAPFVFSTPHNFLPKIPSPLSPRSANIYGRSQFFSFMPDADKAAPAQNVPYSRRAIKKAPTAQPDELKERRRKLFLKKVADGREDRRFEARGEDIMRLDFVQRRKQWEAELAREAPYLSSDPIDEDQDLGYENLENDLPGSSNAMRMSAPSTQQSCFEDQADEVMEHEHAELEALLSYMPTGEDGEQNAADNFENLYSDDDDYDALFSELMEREEVPTSDAGRSSQQQGEAMDMT